MSHSATPTYGKLKT